jgi:hypothetical protein
MILIDREPAVNGGPTPLRGKPRERGWKAQAGCQRIACCNRIASLRPAPRNLIELPVAAD